jgi:NlpC/P60 family
MADHETVMHTRRELVRLGRHCAENQATIHYAETRPIPIDVAPGDYNFTTDCSGFVTILARWAGLPDPNGRHYDGSGNTRTLLDNLTHIDKSQTWRGDLCVFGKYPGEHVVLLLEGGTRQDDPQVVSHGQEAGPLIVNLSAEIQAHAPEQTYLRIMPND